MARPGFVFFFGQHTAFGKCEVFKPLNPPLLKAFLRFSWPPLTCHPVPQDPCTYYCLLGLRAPSPPPLLSCPLLLMGQIAVSSTSRGVSGSSRGLHTRPYSPSCFQHCVHLAHAKGDAVSSFATGPRISMELGDPVSWLQQLLFYGPFWGPL